MLIVPKKEVMYLFLVPLLLGFASDCASAFTTAYSHRWGERGGQATAFILRSIFGIPLWFIGLVLALRSPSTARIAQGPALVIPGWVLILGGCVPMVIGLLNLRSSAALPLMQDGLVERGIYTRIRHPIYTGMLLEFTGLALLNPKPTALLACGLGLGWVFVNARLEELDLMQRIPAYREYMRRVPRFFPHLWIKTKGRASS